MIRCVVKQKQATFEWKKTPVTLLHGEGLPSEKNIVIMEMDDFHHCVSVNAKQLFRQLQ